MQSEKEIYKTLTTEEWKEQNPILPFGVAGYEVDGSEIKMKMGTGDKSWLDLPYIPFGGSGGGVDAFTKQESENLFVAKEEGKGLSSNDFTDSEKEKLENLSNSGSGGGSGTPNAVQYTPQELTQEQIAQALANLNLGLAPVDMSTVPDNLPRYTVTGESPYKSDILLTPRMYNNAGGNLYLYVMNHKGELLAYHKVDDLPYSFKKVYNSRGEVRYVYLESLAEFPTYNDVGFYHNCKLVIMDKDFRTIDERMMMNDTYVNDGDPIDSHQLIFIDDGHYIYANYYMHSNGRLENCIQEVRYGKLVFTWHTTDHPELYDAHHTDTQNTGDYSHINTLCFDYDGHILASLRNVGCVKINRVTGKVMWVIGRNRNDFAGIPTRMLPFQQHDFKFIPKDGSYTMFDNAGHESNSRILKYSLNQETMTATKVEEFVVNEQISGSMGSAVLLDLEGQVFDVNCGGGFSGFQEYDFKNNVQLMNFEFEDGYDLYNVFRDTSSLYSGVVFPNMPYDSSYVPPVTPPDGVVDKTSLRTEIATVEALTASDYTSASWSVLQTKLTEAKAVEANSEATQEEVNTATSALAQARLDLVLDPEIPSDMPTPVYTLSEKVFDGTDYIDTGYKLFDTNKDWSITARYFMDSSVASGTDPMSVYNCWEEWGAGDKGLYCGSAYGVESLKMNSVTTSMHNSTTRGKDTIYTVIYDSSQNKVFITYRFTDGSIVTNPDTLVAEKEASFTYSASGLYIDKNLIIGALQMDEAGTMARHYKGTMKHFNVYDKALSDSELATIVDSMKA